MESIWKVELHWYSFMHFSSNRKLGANGAGKSTLLKLMAGELEASTGQVVRNPKLRFAKFSQHFVEQLEDFNVSPLEHFMEKNPGIPMQTARNHLGCKMF